MEDPHKPSFLEVREHLKTSEYDRSYLYWSADEDQYLLRLHQEKRLSNLEIAKILRRTLGSIKARLKLHGIDADGKVTNSLQFAKFIQEGINPITGEVLSADSAWRHPSIISDITDYLSGNSPTAVKEAETQQTKVLPQTERERSIFVKLIRQVDNLLPKVSKRDASLVKYLYASEDQRVTLQDAALHFGISKERVRQIRERVLKSLRLGLTHRQIEFSKRRHEKQTTFSKSDALAYLDEVLKFLCEPAAQNDESAVSPVEPTDDQILNLIAGKLFFRIEEYESFTPFSEKNQILRDSFTDTVINERRTNNWREGRLLNYFFPITWEEYAEMEKRFLEGQTASELEDYFQRSFKSIYTSLEREGHIAPSASNEEIKFIQKEFANGKTSTELSKTFNRSIRSIELILKLDQA